MYKPELKQKMTYEWEMWKNTIYSESTRIEDVINETWFCRAFFDLHFPKLSTADAECLAANWTEGETQSDHKTTLGISR